MTALEVQPRTTAYDIEQDNIEKEGGNGCITNSTYCPCYE